MANVQIQNQSTHTIMWNIPLPAPFTQASLLPLRVDPGATVSLDSAVVAANRAADALVDGWFTRGDLVQL